MATYTITTGGDGGLTDEMLLELVQCYSDVHARLGMIARQLEPQLPRTLKIGDTCHATDEGYPYSASMKLVGLHEGTPWVLDAEGDYNDAYKLPELAYGPRPS